MAGWSVFVLLVSTGLTGASIQPPSESDSAPAVLERSKRTMNMESYYTRWPDNVVYYYYDKTTNYYTQDELQLIETAIRKLQELLFNAVRFVPVDHFSSNYKVKITPADSVLTPTIYSADCHSYPGRVANGDPSLLNEQPITLVRGAERGCLNSVRHIMKFFVVLLGRRNEFQRRDRDNYMTVFYNNIVFPDTFKIYAPSQDDESTPFDQCSITFEEPTRWAKAGTTAWSFKDGYNHVLTQPILSTPDCQQLLSWYGYGAWVNQCPVYDCLKIRQTSGGTIIVGTPTNSPPLPPSPTSTYTPLFPAPSPLPVAPPVTAPVPAAVTTAKPAPPPAATTSPKPAPAPVPAPVPTPAPTAKPVPAPSVNPAPNILPILPCECSNFCNVAPTESAFMAGPYNFYQTYLLFSGTCVAEYVTDWDKMELQLQTTPAPFASYFDPQAGRSLQSPVTLAFMTHDTPQSPSYNGFFQSQGDSKSLQCTGKDISTKGAACPKPADSANVIPTSVATSASPQLYLGNNTVYQYVVDSSSTNIKLMDASFKTTYQTSSGFLDGQSKISRITAIQVTVDEVNVHPFVLAVFGIGTDNVTPYVGFVQMDLLAHPGVPLSPRKWLKEPVSLKTGISNCESLKLRPTSKKVPPPKAAVTPKTSPRPIY